ncbi:hypothetical protein [Deinococcus pimensis]|uniref:hypothetical protein n=1 Tax=Deinococcus pimensis TaxID=309888 RepID=UPI0004861B8A|nr:hypothetical protein [Deinococcus pimensis]
MKEFLEFTLSYVFQRFAGGKVPQVAQDAIATLLAEFLDGDLYMKADARFSFQERLEAELQRRGL